MREHSIRKDRENKVGEKGEGESERREITREIEGGEGEREKASH